MREMHMVYLHEILNPARMCRVGRGSEVSKIFVRLGGGSCEVMEYPGPASPIRSGWCGLRGMGAASSGNLQFSSRRLRLRSIGSGLRAMAAAGCMVLRCPSRRLRSGSARCRS